MTLPGDEVFFEEERCQENAADLFIKIDRNFRRLEDWTGEVCDMLNAINERLDRLEGCDDTDPTCRHEY